MKISSIFIFGLTFANLLKSLAQDTVNFAVDGLISDKSGYLLTGVQIHFSYLSKEIGVISTREKGVFNFSGTLPKSANNNYNLVSTIIVTDGVPPTIITNPSIGNSTFVYFNIGRIQVTNFNDVDQQTFVRCQLDATFVDSVTKSKAVNGYGNFYIVANNGTTAAWYHYEGQGINNGRFNIFFVLPQNPFGQFIGFYVASAPGFWNAQMNNTKDIDNSPYQFNYENEFYAQIQIPLVAGQITQIFNGKIFNSANQPIQGAKVAITYQDQQTYTFVNYTQTFISDATGSYSAQVIIKSYTGVAYTLYFSEIKHVPVQKNIDNYYNLSDPSKTVYTTDVGIIQIYELTITMTVKGVITDLTKVQSFVPGATVIITLTPSDSVAQNLSAITDANGQYSINFQAPQDKTFTLLAQISAKDFISINKTVQFTTTNQPQTIQMDSSLDRNLVIVTLSEQIFNESKQPIQNATIEIVVSTPYISNSKYYLINTTDKTEQSYKNKLNIIYSGTFSLQFQCYQDVNFKITFQVVVFRYIPYQITQNFTCINSTITLSPAYINLQKINVSAEIDGKVIGPSGAPQANLALSLVTDPVTQQVTGKTDATGQFALIDALLNIQTGYNLQISFINGLQKQSTISNAIITTDQLSEKFAFPEIFYQDIVNAVIFGTIFINNKTTVVQVQLDLDCDAFARDGLNIKNTAKTMDNGSYIFQFQPVATFNQTITCNIKMEKNTAFIEQKTTVLLKAPNFTSRGDINTTYNQIPIQINGVITDANGVEPSVPNATISLTLSPTDPLDNQLSVQSGPNGTYTLKFNAVQDQTYTANLTITDQPYFSDYKSNPIIIKANSAQNITQNAALYRNELNTTITSTLVDQDGKPIQNATIVIKDSTPHINTTSDYNFTLNDSNMYLINFNYFISGNFNFNFTCYKDMNTTITYQINVPTYIPQTVTSQIFNCSSGQIPLTPVKITLTKITYNLTVLGSVLDPTGKGFAGLQLNFSTIPPTINQTVTTNAAGNWSILDSLILPNQSYTINVQFQDPLNELIVQSYNFTESINNTQATFPVINYPNFVNSTISGVLIYNSTPEITPLQVNLTCDALDKTKKNITISTKSNNVGQFNLTFSPLASFNKILNCSVVTEGTPQIKSVSVPVQLKEPDFSLKLNISIDHIYFNTTFSGKVLDPFGKPYMVGLPLQFYTIPFTMNSTITTDKNGTWTFTDSKIIPETQFQVYIAFENAIKQTILANQTVSETLNNQNISFVQLNYSDFVNASVSGNINILNQTVTTPLTIMLACDAVDKTNKTINISTQSNDKGNYNFSFSPLAEVDKPIKCNLFQQASTQIEASNSSVQLLSPTFTATSNLSTNFAYVTTVISGKVLNPLGNPQGGLLLSYSTIPQTISQTVNTSADGSWQISDNKTLLQQNYSVLITFYDALKNFNEVSQNVSITAPNQKIVYQDMYYGDFVNSTINGSVVNGNISETTILNLTLKCSANDKTNKSIMITGNSNSKGQFNFTIQPLALYDKPIDCSVQSTPTIKLKEAVVQFELQKPTWNANVTLQMQNAFVNALISGSFIGPSGKPLPQLQINISTVPDTMNQSLITSANGTWAFNDTKLLLQDNYTVIVSYLDGLKDPTSQNFSFYLQNANQNVNFPTINYQDVVNSTIEGIVLIENTTANIPLQLELTCQTEDKTKKLINISTNSSTKGTYNFSFEPIAEYDKAINCTLQSLATPQIKNQSIQISLKEPNFSVNQNLSVEFNYQWVQINGKVLGPQGKGYPNLSLNFLTDPTTINQTVQTLQDGSWSINDTKMLLQQNYSIILIYADPLKEQMNQSIKLAQITPNSKINFTDIYYPDFVNVSIEGQLSLANNAPVSTPINLTLHCNSVDKTNKSINISEISTAQGSYNFSFQTLAEYDKVINCSIVTNPTPTLQSQTIQFNLTSPNYTQTENMTIQFAYVTSILSGRVLAPNGKGEAGLTMNFSTIPPTINQTITTGPDGAWSINDPKMLIGTNYTVQLNYLDGTKDPVNQTFQMNQTGDNQKQVLPDINYLDVVNATIDGNVLLNNASYTTPLQLNFICDSVDKTKKPIQIEANSTVTGKFNFTFQPMAQFDKPLNCTINSSATPQIKPSSISFQVSEPNYTKSVNLTVQYAYVSNVINGKVLAPSGKGESGLALNFYTIPQTINQSVTTLQDGSWSVNDTQLLIGDNYTIYISYIDALKEQLNETMMIHINATNQTINFANISYPDFVSASISGSILIGNATETVPVQLTLACDSVNRNKSNITLTQNSTDKGAYNFTFDTLAQFDKQINCLLKSTETSQLKSGNTAIQLSEPNYTSISNLQLSYAYVNTAMSGKLIGPDGKPEAGINLTITTDPPTINQTVITGPDGSYHITDNSTLLGTNYSINVSFTDGAKNQVNQTFKVNVTTPNQSISLPNISYPSFVNASISGSISGVNQNVTLTLTCDTLDSNKKNISMTLNTSGPFQFKFDTLAESDKDVNCTITSNATIQLKSENITVKLSSPNFTTNAANVSIEYAYTNALIAGRVISPNGNGTSNVSLNFSSIPMSLNQTILTDKDGNWQLNDTKMLQQQEYTFEIFYLNPFKVELNQTKKVNITAPNQKIDFQQINYEDFVNASITGRVMNGNQTENTTLTIELTCDSVDKNNKSINLNTTTANGNFALQFYTLGKFDQQINCTISSLATPLLKGASIQLQLEEPYFNKSVIIQLETNYVTSLIKGKVLEPNGMPASNISLNFSTIPTSINQTIVTLPDGSWQVNDTKMLLFEVYNIQINYLDGLKNPQIQQFSVNQSQTVQNVSFPDINYPNIVNALVSGNIKLENLTETETLMLTLVCNSTNSTKQPILITTKSNNGSFNFSFTPLAEFDKIINCTVTSDPTTQLLSGSVNFQLSEPAFNKSNLTLNIEYAYQNVSISGKILNPEGKGQQGLNVNFSTIPGTINQTFVTGVDGGWNVTDGKMLLQDSYAIQLSFLDALKQPINYIQQQNITQTNQKVAINDTYYPDLVNATIAGKIMNGNSSETAIISLNLICDAVDKNKLPIKMSGNSTLQGTFNFTFSPLAQFDRKINCTVISNATDQLKSANVSFQLIQPNYTANPTLQLSFAYISTVISGKIVSPSGKGRSNLTLNYSTIPATVNSSLTTGPDGIWTVTDMQMLLDENYTLEIAFLDVFKLPVNQTLNITLKTSNQSITFPNYNYSDFVNASVQGTILSGSQNVSIPISLTMVCNTTDAQKKPIQIDGNSTPQGIFNFSFTPLAEYDKPITCNITTKENDLYKSSQSSFQLAAPNFNATTIVQLSNSYVSSVISGKIKLPSGQGKQGFMINFSTIPSTINQSIITDPNGKWTVNDPEMILHQNYTLLISFVDVFKQPENYTYNVTLTMPNQQISLPDYNYSDFVNSSISGTIVVNNQTIVNPVELTLQCNSTDVNKKPISAIQNSTDKGTFNFTFQPLAEFDKVINCSITTKENDYYKSANISFNLTEPTFTDIEVIKLNYSYLSSMITGRLKSPTGSGKQGVSLNFSTVPQTITQNVLTGADGTWTINDTQMLFHQNYTIEIQFLDIFKQSENQTFNVTILSANQKVTLPDFNYSDFVNASVQGTILSGSNPITTPVQVTLTCNSTDSEKKPIMIVSNSTTKGTFNFTFQTLAEFDKSIYCNVTTKETDEYKSAFSSLSLSEPNFNGSTSVQLSNSYVNAIIVGKIKQPSGQGKQGVNLNFTTLPMTINATSLTAADGSWSINDAEMIMHDNYTLIITFLDAFKQPETQNMTVIISAPNQKITFPDYNFSDFVNSSVSGSLNAGNQSLNTPVQLTLECNSTDPQKKPIFLTTNSSSNGSFNFNFSTLGQYDKNITCTLVMNGTDQLKPMNKTIELSEPNFSTSGVSVSYEYSYISTVISGQVIGPTGKPQSGLNLLFATTPNSVNMSSTTDNSGLWSVTDTNLINATNYQLFVNFQDALKDSITYTEDIKIPSANNKINFTNIYYPDFVNATINGQIFSGSSLQNTPLKVNLSCNAVDKTNKSIQLQTTSSNGNFSFQFTPLAQFNKTITCNLQSEETAGIQSATSVVVIGEPTFQNSTKLQTSYHSVQIQLIGQVLDAENLVPGVAGVNVSLTLQPEDPLINGSLISITDTKGNYHISFLGIMNQQYQATLEVNGTPAFQDKKVSFVMETASTNNFTQNVTLERTILKVELDSILLDTTNKSIPNATITILKSEPEMADKSLYNTTFKDQSNGSFALQFACYQNVQTTIYLMMESDTYSLQPLQSQNFNCSSSKIELKPFTANGNIKEAKVNVSGLVLDAFGKPFVGLKLQFSTTPTTEQLNVISNANGQYTLIDDKCLVDMGYLFDLMYFNLYNQETHVNKSFTLSSQLLQNLTMDTIYYEQLVNANVSGSLVNKNQPVTKSVNITITCNTTGADGKPLNQTIVSNNGKFNFSLSMGATYQAPIKCTVTSQATTGVQSNSESVVLVPPNYNANISIQTEYNKETLTLDGYITDQSGLQTVIPNTEIDITLIPEDTLSSNISAKTNQLGYYSVSFDAVAGDNYSAVYSIKPSSTDFIGVTSLPIPVIGSHLTKNFSLERLTINSTLSLQFIDQDKQPLSDVQVTFNKSTPNKQENKSFSTDSSGHTTVVFTGYKDVLETIVFELQSAEYNPSYSNPITFNCSSPSLTLPPIQVTMELKTITLNVTGQLLNPENKGQPGVPLTLSSIPVTKSFQSTTDSEGNFQFIDNALSGGASYQLLIQYLNMFGQNASQSFSYVTTSDPKQSFNGSKVYYKSQVKVNIEGKVGSEDIQAGYELIMLNCNGSDSQDNSFISDSTTTSADGSYKFEIKMFAELDEVYECDLTTQGNKKFEASKTIVMVKPPEFHYNQQISLKETQEFKDQIRKFYEKLTVIGQVISDFNCTDNPERPLKGAKVQLFQWNGNQYITLNQQNYTSSAGVFRFTFQLLKSRLQSTIEVEISKSGYIGYNLFFVPQLIQSEQQDYYLIDLGMVSLTHINGTEQCPEEALLAHEDIYEHDYFQHFQEVRKMDYIYIYNFQIKHEMHRKHIGLKMSLP